MLSFLCDLTFFGHTAVCIYFNYTFLYINYFHFSFQDFQDVFLLTINKILNKLIELFWFKTELSTCILCKLN